jgi:hypothetical protein
MPICQFSIKFSLFKADICFGKGILDTSNFRASLELFLSVFQDELAILR